MKRAQPSSSPLAAALDEATAKLRTLQVDSRAPSMATAPVFSPLGVNANDAAIELPGIVERNEDTGIYPAQDGYVRDPQTAEERELAQKSQYGIDWQEQKRQRELLLNRDPTYKLVKAIAGATQRSIDRFVQGPNQELVDIQRQRAIEQSRREIAIYGPDFEALENRIENLKTEKTSANKKRQEELNAILAGVNNTMRTNYETVKKAIVDGGMADVAYTFGNAERARNGGNWWVLPVEIRAMLPSQYASISIDLTTLFCADAPEKISVWDYAMIPKKKENENEKPSFVNAPGIIRGKRSISVLPYLYTVYTHGILNSIRYYMTADRISEMSVRQLMMTIFLLMNGGTYSAAAHEKFEDQMKAFDQSALDEIYDSDGLKLNVLLAAINNWTERLFFVGGDLNTASTATFNLNNTTEEGNPEDASMFYGVSGSDSVPIYRKHVIGSEMSTNFEQDLISLINRKKDDVDKTPISLTDVYARAKENNYAPKDARDQLKTGITNGTNPLERIADSFTRDHANNLFQALLYFAGFFTRFAGLGAENFTTFLKELRAIIDVTRFNRVRAPNVRSIMELYEEPTPAFSATDNLDQRVQLSTPPTSVHDVRHLMIFISSIRKVDLGMIENVVQESTNIQDAIRAAQQRIIDMTRENYESIRRRADQLILSGEMDITPSFYSMGNSIEYATEPQNIGLIVLTPIAYYGIWAAYELLQDQNVPNNDIAGLPFDEIIGNSHLSIRFAKLVAALLASTGLVAGSGYQAQNRSNRIPYGFMSAVTGVLSFAYSKLSRDPLTGEVLDTPRYNVYQKSNRHQGASYLIY